MHVPENVWRNDERSLTCVSRLAFQFDAFGTLLDVHPFDETVANAIRVMDDGVDD
jgi:hypothetical protein